MPCFLGSFQGYSQALYLGTGAQLVVSAGDALFVDDDITNNGTIELISTTSRYAQLKLSGSYSGTGTFSQQQYLTSGWHLLSSPVTDGFNGTSNGSTPALYAFNTDLAGGNPGYVAWSTSYNESDRGFYGKVGATGDFLQNAGMFTITGAPNTSTSARSIGMTSAVTSNGAANGSGTGWNLLGNPFSCGLDWYTYQNNTTPTILNNAVYIWDPSAGSGLGAYQTYNGYVTGALTIPPMQAFWVQVFYPSGGTLPASDMGTFGTLETASFFKQLPPRLDLVVTAIGDSNRSDRTILAHIPGGALAFDGITDAWKLSNGLGMPNLMTCDDATGQEMSINGLDLGESGVIPVAFRGGNQGEKWLIDVEGDLPGEVLLEDRLLQTFTDLRIGGHAFINAGWTLEESRFRLHFIPAAKLGDAKFEGKIANELIAYAADDWVWVRSSGNVGLFTVEGRELARTSSNELIQRIPRPAPGIYLVRAGVRACKIIIP